jgi:hypothetical protein
LSAPPLRGADIRSVPYGDRQQLAVVFACSSCGREHAERFPGGRMSPEHAAKRARRAGWIAEPDRASGSVCPECQAARRERAPGERPEPKKEPAVSVTPMITAQVPPTLREPTQQERMKIRSALDQHFDDAAGCYLAGYSDQRIGTELNVPWAMIAKIREAAYGPIKVDPEIAGLRAEVTGLGAKIEALVKEQQGVLSRLAALEKKRAAA